MASRLSAALAAGDNSLSNQIPHIYLTETNSASTLVDVRFQILSHVMQVDKETLQNVLCRKPDNNQNPSKGSDLETTDLTDVFLKQSSYFTNKKL